MKRIWKTVKDHKIWLGIYLAGVHLLALVGLVFMGVFVAIKFKITDVPGKVDVMSQEFAENAEKISTELPSATESSESAEISVKGLDDQIKLLNQKRDGKINYLCTMEELSYVAPKNVEKIMTVWKTTDSEAVANQMIFAVKTHLDNPEQFENQVESCVAGFDNRKIEEKEITDRVADNQSADIFGWPNKEEWQNVKLSIDKDKEIINKAAEVAGIDPRLIVSDLMVEQLRLFYSQRELYKRYFEPLKILANSYKISLGVMAIKEETAVQIENHLKDRSSPYYLGEKYEHLLDYPEGIDVGSERYNRLSSNSHYYSYLYGALYIKEMMVQWQRAGFDISNRPEIIGTLFNVGFAQSKPNASPKVGGSTVKIDQTEYSFGRLSYEFFFSGEMAEEFPLGIKSMI